jgi:hypothetical protein
VSVDVKWTDTDPETGQRRFLAARRFAGRWEFKLRRSRRGEDWVDVAPTRVMWETLLEALERRYRRREGVSDVDLNFVRRTLAEWRDPPSLPEE